MSTSVATPRHSIYGETLARRIIAVDGVANVVVAIVLWAGASTWMSAFGLTTSLPVIVLGAVLLVNGIECWIASRRPRIAAHWLWILAGIDAAFAASALAVAVVDPTGAEPWIRWVLGAAAGGAMVTAAVKGSAAKRSQVSEDVT